MSPQVLLEEIAASVIHIDADSSLNEGSWPGSLLKWGMRRITRWMRRDSFPSGAELLISLISRKKILTVLSCGGRKWNPSEALTFSASAVWKKLNEVDIYPATEMMLSEEQKEKGLRRIERKQRNSKKSFGPLF